MPSRKTISVGIDVIWKPLARSCSSSVSTFPKTMSSCLSDAVSKTGAKARQGPHQPAQKSTRTMPPSEIVCSKLSSVIVVVAMVAGSQRPNRPENKPPRLALDASISACECLPSHQLDAGTVRFTALMCCPHPDQVVLPQTLHVTAEHIFRSPVVWIPHGVCKNGTRTVARQSNAQVRVP